MNLTERAQTIFAADRYATDTTGIEIMQVGNHEAQCALEVDNRHCNARGVAMGGALCTLADFSVAIAANTDCLESGELHWVSLDSSISFLAPASKDSRLEAWCSALKVGRTTSLYQTMISNRGTGRLVAVATTTMVSLSSPRSCSR